MEAVRRVAAHRRRRLLVSVIVGVLIVDLHFINDFITCVIFDVAGRFFSVHVSIARPKHVALGAVEALAICPSHVIAARADEITVVVADLVITSVAAVLDEQKLISAGEDVFVCASLSAFKGVGAC